MLTSPVAASVSMPFPPPLAVNAGMLPEAKTPGLSPPATMPKFALTPSSMNELELARRPLTEVLVVSGPAALAPALKILSPLTPSRICRFRGEVS